MRVAIRYNNNKEDAGAMVNQSFLKILQNIESYNLDKPLEPWIKRIAINTAIDEFRKNKKYLENEKRVDTSVYENDFIINTVFDESIDYEELIKTIKQILPKSTATVFFLKYVEGFSHKEIATKLSITLETSKWHIKKAKKALILNKQKLVS